MCTLSFVMTQTGTLSSSSTSNPIGTILGSVGHGMWLAATSSPWAGGVFCLLIVLVMVRIYRAIRWAPIAAAELDPLRRFTGVDRASIFSRAGARCERHSLLFGRCKETEKLHADHVHPHSKGGSTTVANGQVLCSRHNKQKAARIPFNWELRRLAKQRASYLPAGDSGAVVRRAKL